MKLLLGEDSPAIADGRALGIQCLSGTGALRMGAEFLVRQLGRSVFYYSTPTWDNHHRVFMDAGFKEARQYRYWDPVNRNINFVGFKADLEAAPEGAVILLHACAHNPTGRQVESVLLLGPITDDHNLCDLVIPPRSSGRRLPRLCAARISSRSLTRPTRALPAVTRTRTRGPFGISWSRDSSYSVRSHMPRTLACTVSGTDDVIL